jgi:hypothetical protein
MPLRIIVYCVILTAACTCSGKMAHGAGFVSMRSIGVGYSASTPEAPLGFCAFSLNSNGPGLYLDIKAGVPMISRRDDYYGSISVRQAEAWGDVLQSEESNWLSLNVGLTYRPTASVAVYGGLGYSWCSCYRQYYDEFHILGSNGDYWVDAPGGDSGINAIAGILLPVGQRWGLQLGGETMPRGVTVGVFVYS